MIFCSGSNAVVPEIILGQNRHDIALKRFERARERMFSLWNYSPFRSEFLTNYTINI